MAAFRDFVEQENFVEFVMNEFAGAPQTGAKPWSAKKPEILQIWRNVQPNLPIYMTPITKKTGDGGTQSYGEDGIRITGSWNFIASVMGRVKDLMAYENPQMKLRLVLRGVDKSHGDPSKVSYVFYVNAEHRGRGKAGRPRTTPPTV